MLIRKHHVLSITILFGILIRPQSTLGQKSSLDPHLNITLREIGHKILLTFDDDTSTVLPVIKQENRYKVSFENKFKLDPLKLANVIHPIILKSKTASKYRVEVQLCDSNAVVYGYEIGEHDSTSLIACVRRLQPLGCYDIYFTILEKYKNNENRAMLLTESSKNSWQDKTTDVTWGASIAIIIGLALFRTFRNNNASSAIDSYTISIGKYQFNKRSMMLSHQNGKTELTGKEADLLVLLFSDVNHTIEREKILNQVWGDEGGYVGRTLDVFISKLRKKLENDPAIKIINIRGIGYKLIVTE
ncbi:MAG: winged helix-turn-helix domain-containing protein [Crocinitomicaceae bacterium]